jgi:DNA mismatch repair ATPase MutL
MQIAALPTTTVSAIGSCQVLTDSCSLVKELIDNALDAHATSIGIEISPNALDIIQAKDNGSGISPEDFEMVCKMNCTSKITTLEDLRQLGGKSLGFRGQALASAVEMSGGLRLTTKTDKDVVAKAIEFERNGGVLR